MVLLKLVLAPMLVALATLVARRWGPKAGGILMGFPLTTGPIFLFLALEQGTEFAEQAAVGALLGLVGLSAFAWIYAVAKGRTDAGFDSLALCSSPPVWFSN
jgi:drug/metabolite transporter (DMT)-like permease